jgi:hypothetical protein
MTGADVAHLRVSLLTACLLLACVAGLTACAGDATPTSSAVVRAENTELGQTIAPENWVITLIEPPEQLKLMGERVEGGGWWSNYSREGANLAEGKFVIVPVELTNDTDEERMFPQLMLKVIDAQGREYAMSLLPAHHIYIWTTERWMDDENQLVQNVYDPGRTREGPIIFDVAEDATGLRMTADGSDESIDLGF